MNTEELRARYPRYKIGDGTYAGKGFRVCDWGDGQLSIGKYCSIASDVSILLGGEHRTDWVTTYPFQKGNGHPTTKGGVHIGNDVWIGHGATILSGAFIGDGAVIGAKAMVGSGVFPYEIVIGNPARNLRWRFSHEHTKAIRRIAWWDWPEEKIKEAMPLLLSNRIEEFIDKYK